SPLWDYLTTGAARGRSPNAWFDERWYLETHEDVAAAKAAGVFPSGFVHYLRHGQHEGRAPRPSSDAWFNSLSRPIALDRLADIERKVRPLPYKIFRPNGQRRVNVLVPTLDRDLLFAGYI